MPLKERKRCGGHSGNREEEHVGERQERGANRGPPLKSELSSPRPWPAALSRQERPCVCPQELTSIWGYDTHSEKIELTSPSPSGSGWSTEKGWKVRLMEGQGFSCPGRKGTLSVSASAERRGAVCLLNLLPSASAVPSMALGLLGSFKALNSDR